jgi:hypothetical protein
METFDSIKAKVDEVKEKLSEVRDNIDLDEAMRAGGKAATKTAKRASNAINQAAGTEVGEVAHKVSSQLERTIAREPANSLMRSITLALAGVSVLSAMSLHMAGRKHEALLIGQLAPTLVGIALWDQIVKSQRRGLFGA